MLDCFTDEPAVINDFLEKNQGSREFTFDSIEFKHENNKGRIMNKELIKKYQKEFISWVNGEELLIKGSNGWISVGDDFSWDESTDSIIVLKDEYSEFRIALAEGKIVEVAVNHNDVDGYIWERVEDDDFHCFHIDEIRIKPDYLKSSDNLKFKVGDIAIHNGKFRKISKVIDGMLDCFTDGPAVIMKNDTLEIWRPKVGESCLFSNKDEEPIIGTFLEMFNGDLYVMAADKINTFEFCEPIKKYRNCSNCANCEKAPSHPNYKDAFGWCNAVVPFFANHKPLIKKKDFKECAAFKEVEK